MFIEHRRSKSKVKGWLEVICGSMFSGKTEELIRRLKRAKIAKLEVQIFKPQIDTRYHENKVVSHDSNSISSVAVASSKEILTLAQNFDVIGVDEVQFFDEDIVEVCNALANQGIRVLVAGLDMDFEGKPFGPMPLLMATAEFVTKVHAICVSCGDVAQYSHRIHKDKQQVLLGEKNEYEPLCRVCYTQK
ncbi:MAG: thymidine kinase [Flavobacteriales bacterium]|jgi:thymidine kinase|nr:thymidine kinase [Flavobacteriales bacterium]